MFKKFWPAQIVLNQITSDIYKVHIPSFLQTDKDWCTLIQTNRSIETLLRVVWINVHQSLAMKCL